MKKVNMLRKISSFLTLAGLLGFSNAAYGKTVINLDGKRTELALPDPGVNISMEGFRFTSAEGVEFLLPMKEFEKWTISPVELYQLILQFKGNNDQNLELYLVSVAAPKGAYAIAQISVPVTYHLNFPLK